MSTSLIRCATAAALVATCDGYMPSAAPSRAVFAAARAVLLHAAFSRRSFTRVFAAPFHAAISRRSAFRRFVVAAVCTPLCFHTALFCFHAEAFSRSSVFTPLVFDAALPLYFQAAVFTPLYVRAALFPKKRSTRREKWSTTAAWNTVNTS